VVGGTGAVSPTAAKLISETDVLGVADISWWELPG